MFHKRYNQEELPDEKSERVLQYYYHVLELICGIDFGIWYSFAVDANPFDNSPLASGYPFCTIAGTLLFFLLAKIILNLLDESLLSRILACVVGLLLTAYLTFNAVSVFLLGNHPSYLAFTVFLLGIASLPIFSLALIGSTRFFEFICYTSLGTLLVPHSTQGWKVRLNSSGISGLLLVAGLIIGVILQSI